MSHSILRNYLKLLCAAFLLLIVRADFTPSLPEADPISSPPLEVSTGTVCECQMFIQSWKTSHMIRLPISMEPIELNSTTTEGNICLALCQQRIPAQSEESTSDRWWNKLYRRACRTLLVNDYQVRQSLRTDNLVSTETLKNSKTGPVRGCLQAYARSSNTHIWVPMGVEYRKVLSCSLPPRRRRRSLRNSGLNKQNSIDAQSVVSNNNPGTEENARPPPTLADSTRNPLTFNLSPIRTLLKQFGLLSPYVDNVIGMLDRMNVRDVLGRVNLGGYVDRYQKLYNEYTEELDVGHCFMEYAVYTIFNHRFALKNLIPTSSSRGFEEDAMGMALKVATEFLQRDNATHMLTSLFKMLPSGLTAPPPSGPSLADPVPDVQSLATNIARFYLRNYFSTLPGSTVRVDEKDPANNPESLADMVEQVSRPVFLSVFGVVPGVPASGRLDHLLLIASKSRPSPTVFSPPSQSLFGTESRNKLQPLDQPLRQSLPLEVVTHSYQPGKTGNWFFDLGNTFFGTVQRANDATHGLYCAKQYAVNKMWDVFRGGMRRMMRAIPSTG